MKTRTYKEVEEWLKLHGLFEKVKANIEKEYILHPYTLGEIYKHINGSEIEFLSSSFQFDNTPEGADFWIEVNMDFRLWFQHHDNKSLRLRQLYKLRDALKFEVDFHPEEDDWDEVRKLYFATLDKIKKLES